MSKFSELRERVMSMPEQDCRQELADTLRELGQLEADFEVLLQCFTAEHMRGGNSTLREITERRGLK